MNIQLNHLGISFKTSRTIKNNQEQSETTMNIQLNHLGISFKTSRTIRNNHEYTTESFRNII